MILVTGATGNVGGEVVRAVSAAGADVRALVRDERATLPAGVRTAVGDLDHPDTLTAALDGVRAVFLLSGFRDMPGVLARLDRAGVDRVVLLSGSSAASGDTGNAISAYMIRSETAVRESGTPWTILRPFGLMSNTLRWLPQLRQGDVVREPFADVPVAMIDPFDVAAVAAGALLGRRPGGDSLVLTGPQPLLPGDRVRVLGALLGRDLRLEALPNDEARAQLSDQMPIAYVDAFFDFYVAGPLDESAVLDTVHDITGRRPRTFAEWATAHIQEFTP